MVDGNKNLVPPYPELPQLGVQTLYNCLYGRIIFAFNVVQIQM